ncbi:GpE family phage tail protein [Pectobacterium brasiliense]|uniref:GpE family phage tail protein n=1 Tax=Pectobacterium brasiliense TaxID=180957 RepID=UPI00301A0891
MGFLPAVQCGGHFFATLFPSERDGRGNGVIHCPFNRVEEVMADIAAIFHWLPSAMDAMPVDELLAWRSRAAVRSGNSE